MNINIRTSHDSWRTLREVGSWRVMEGHLYLYTKENKVFHVYAPGSWEEMDIADPWGQK